MISIAMGTGIIIVPLSATVGQSENIWTTKVWCL